MKNKRDGVFIIIAILLVLIISITWAFDRLYYPSYKTAATYLAVHQEIEESAINSIHIKSINHKVVIKASEDDIVKVIYYQKSDNANVYSADNKRIQLNLTEQVEEVDNLFFKSEKKIDTIVIYLPKTKAFSVYLTSTDGELQINDVELKEITYNNIYGNVNIDSLISEKMTITLNYGEVNITNSAITNSQLNVVSGKVNYTIPNSIYEYNDKISTTYGLLKLNDEKLYTIDETTGEEKIINEIVNKVQGHHSITIVSTRAEINLYTVEPEANENK